MNNDWLLEPCASIDESALAAATARQSILTKPAGSLGTLETIAELFAAWQGLEKPVCDTILVRVFAADHGVCSQGVSAFPQEVTAQMILNFISGGAAISVLSKQLDADFSVINMGIVDPTVIEHIKAPNLINAQLVNGTNDFTTDCAMSESVLTQALVLGREQISNNNAHLFIGGEMGIGNTTSASAIYSALLELPPEVTVGPGTGVDKDGLKIKRQVIYRAFNFHGNALASPLDILRCIGGLEIAGLVGAYIAAAQKGMPVLVDGFISTAAALVACGINQDVRKWMLFAHKSAEPAHIKALEHLQATPLLDLGLRLGEGSGAATAVPLIQSALNLHNNMATFGDASVSAGEN